jgi:hypothetical protein
VVSVVHTVTPVPPSFSGAGQVVAGVVLVAVGVVFFFAWFLAALLEGVRRVEVGNHEPFQFLDGCDVVYALFYRGLFILQL